MNLTKDDVRQVIANTLSVPLEIIDSNLSYQSISEWDSLRHITLMLALEKNFQVKIDQNKILDLTSLDSITHYIIKKVDPNQVTNNTEVKINSISINRGLNNVYFDESKIAFIDTENSKLFYRGYLIDDLVNHVNYEQVAYLLLSDGLPDPKQLSAFTEKLKSQRELPTNITMLIKILAKNQSLINVIRTAMSALSQTLSNLSLYEQGIAYIAKIPTIIGTYFSIRNNTKLPRQTENMTHAEYLLCMLLGKTVDDEIVHAFEQIMILQAEHDANASAFAARVAKSTDTELGNAMTAAVATFSGMLHGGAITGVMQMLEEISHKDNVKSYIQNRIKNKLPIYGFGHRIYRTIDPRSAPLQRSAELLSQKYSNTQWLEILEKIKIEMTDYMEYGININYDFYTCICYLLIGLSQEMLVPSFVAARSTGWVAHILEQANNNILIRPRLKYVGPQNRKIDQNEAIEIRELMHA